uniref:Uncharacterized protein n=1 Tax=Manihot esculenta TaxID=3983 RepID=A0A2C9U9Z1_MANES
MHMDNKMTPIYCISAKERNLTALQSNEVPQQIHIKNQQHTKPVSYVPALFPFHSDKFWEGF